MTKVLIVYATEHGNTKKMAEAVAAGVESVPDTQVSVLPAEEATEEDVLSSDALIIGTPTHMSSCDWRIKKFIDQVCGPLWVDDRAIGKVGAAFATGGGLGNAGAGCQSAMMVLLNNLAEMGMILIPLPKNTPGYARGGLQWGAYGRSAGENMEQTGVTDEKLEAAKYHGANVARAASVLKGARIFINSSSADSA